MAAPGSIDILVRFSRLASEASSGAEILPLLADAAIDHVQADGAVVVELTEAGARAVAALPRRARGAIAAGPGTPTPSTASLAGQSCCAPASTSFRAGAPRRSSCQQRAALFGALVLFFVADHERRAIARCRSPAGWPTWRPIATGPQRLQVAKLAQANAELRASREVLARTEKMRALGQMAAGLSHDIKNILNPLSMHVQIVKRAIARGNVAQANTSLNEMGAVIRRGVETIDRLRAFSRQSPESRAQKVDLNALAREAMAIARPRMSSRKAGRA